jgi:hypothetical protein
MKKKIKRTEPQGPISYNTIPLITTVKYLRQLSKNEDPYIRSLVASNFYTPPDILRRLSNDRQVSVVISVASNDRCPTTLLRKLMKRKDVMNSTIVVENILQRYKEKKLTLTNKEVIKLLSQKNGGDNNIEILQKLLKLKGTKKLKTRNVRD